MQNKNEFPWWLAKALESSAGEYSPGCGDYTATTLIKPPYLYALEKEHQPEADVSDLFDSFSGNCLHNELERLLSEDPNCIVEKRYYRWIRVESAPGKKDFLISGQIDLYDLTDQTLSDHKNSKIYKFLNTDMHEYEIQMNINAWIMRANGYNPQNLKINAFPKDFNKNEAKTKSNYPDFPFLQIDFPFWDDEDVETFIRNSIVEKENALRGHARLCTEEERWTRPTTHAVMKTGRKTAVRVFNTEKEAQDYIDFHDDSKMYIETRPGRDVRCLDWCPVAQWCSWYQEHYAGANDG